MTEPKLLTETEARGAWQATYTTHTMSITEYFAALRERGLMEPEPVDPLLVEAREICADKADCEEFLDGRWDNGVSMQIALAALRRGREIGLAERPTLTREMVREAADAAAIDHFLRARGNDHPDALDMRLDRLHAALTEVLQ